jgi:hypothetical protein
MPVQPLVGADDAVMAYGATVVGGVSIREAGAVRLNYHRRGRGAPLVLIHGLGSRWQVWAPLLGELSAGRDVIVLELGRRGRASSITALSPVGFFGGPGERWCRTVVTGARTVATALGPALPRLLATRAGRVALCSVFSGHPAALAPAGCLDDARALRPAAAD